MSARLAFDTSTGLGSVAVSVEGHVLARAFLQERHAHAARLIPTVREVLADAGVEMGELEEVVVGSGPGSFTGVRVAAATAKGLVRALDVPLRAFSSLASAALAPELEFSRQATETVGRALRLEESETVLELPGPDELRYVLFDARADRVYGACYQVGRDRFREHREPHAGRIGELLEHDLDPAIRFAGDGAFKHRELLEGAGLRVLSPPAGVPTADGLLRLATLLEGEGWVQDPAGWEPDYVRPWSGGDGS